MPTIELLSGLQIYVFLLNILTEQELKIIRDAEFLKTVSLQHDVIKLKLDTNDTVNTPLLYLEASFQIHDKKVTFQDVYSRNQIREKEIKSLVIAQTPDDGYVWDSSKNTNLYTAETDKYLAIADEIAKMGYRCSSGDDYKTGYYSEISVTDNEIVLKQINYHNSRSIDHREDYFLRDLAFHIPLRPLQEGTRDRGGLDFGKYWIGDMLIYFSDRSSNRNKSCGNAISDKIDEEMNRFR